MICEPTESVEVGYAAFPVGSTVTEPNTVAPSLKTTVPVGTSVPTPMIVAVNVTLFPDTDGLRLDVNMTVVGSTMCSTNTLEVEVAWFASPE